MPGGTLQKREKRGGRYDLEGRPERMDHHNTGGLKIPSKDGEVDPKKGAAGPPRKHFLYFIVLEMSRAVHCGLWIDTPRQDLPCFYITTANATHSSG